jgi:hypothetical protein
MLHCNKIFYNGNRFVAISELPHIMHDCNKLYCHANLFHGKILYHNKILVVVNKGKIFNTLIAFVVAKELPK